MNFHIRFFDCAKKGSVEKLQQIQQFVEINYQNEVSCVAHEMCAATRLDVCMDDSSNCAH